MSMMENALYSVADHMTPKIDKDGVAYTLESRDYKNPQCVALESHPQDSRVKMTGDVNQTISSNMAHDAANGGLVMVIENHPNDSRCKFSSDGMVQTLSGRMGTGGNNTPMVIESINGEVSGTLDSSYFKGCGERQGIEREVVAIGNGQTNQDVADTAHTLNCMHDQEAIIENNLIVRRLTPTECAKLQGYPSDWMEIGEWVDSRGKKHKDADAPKYKAAGNSISLPFWYWLMKRISAYYPNQKPTMASLFDGLGGFPLCWQWINGEGTAIWASEIEEYPIAVTKKRFGENGDWAKFEKPAWFKSIDQEGSEKDAERIPDGNG